MEKSEFLGIDVSKSKIDVCLYDKKELAIFENKKAGFKKMKSWLESRVSDLSKVIICFEHTGIYAVPLQLFCMDQNLDYTIVSGLQVKRSLGIQRGKNDKVDATRLAEYAYLFRDKIKLTILESKQVIKLKYLLSFRTRLVRQRAGFKGSIKGYKVFLELNDSDILIKAQQQLIKMLSKQIKEVEFQIIKLIRLHQKYNQQYQLATSVTGIGLITAAYMIAYTNGFNDFLNWRKFSCYVGSAPFQNRSGSSIHGKTRISNYAQKSIKALLTNAAKSAIAHNPEIKQYYKRKIEEGKHTKIVINNVRNKLISRVFAVIKRGTPCINIAKYAA